MKLRNLISRDLREKLTAHAYDNEAKRLLPLIKARHPRRNRSIK